MRGISGNRAVIYRGSHVVQVQTTEYPGLELREGPGVNEANVGRRCNHGAILKVLASNISGSDQHMVRGGRTSAPTGLVLGHEITGEVIEVGPDVEFVTVGDVVSVPFNIACGGTAIVNPGSLASASTSIRHGRARPTAT